jgi:hypothetical protein
LPRRCALAAVAELRRVLAAEGVDLADILRDARAARAEILERAG